MTSEDIYAILASKQHNPHYLNRYWKFIQNCLKNTVSGKTEKHHICPKAKDLFPEYKSFTSCDWNMAKLQNRQHFIAHWMLWKAYKKFAQQFNAFNHMCNIDHKRINQKTYQILKQLKSESMKGDNNPQKKIDWTGDKNPFFGKKHTQETLQRIKETKDRNGCSTRGMTYEELHGEEKAKQLKSNKIGDLNPSKRIDVRKKIQSKLAGKPKRKTPATIAAAIKRGKEQTGTIWITNGYEDALIFPEDTIPNMWRLGRSSSKQKAINSFLILNNFIDEKTLEIELQKDFASGFKYIEDFLCKYKQINNQIQIRYFLRKFELFENLRRKPNLGATGYIWYNNGISNLRLKPDSMPPVGYIKGKISKNG